MDSAASRTSFAFSYEDFLSHAESGVWPGFARLSIESVSFLKQIHEDSAEDDLSGVGLDDMLALAHAFWSFADERGPDERKVRVRAGIGVDGRPIGRDVLEVVGPDMPFLVDSVMGEVVEQGHSVLAMFHPVVSVARDEAGRRSSEGTERTESFIQVHLPPMNEERRRRLVVGVEATLADVGAAVRDFAAMRRAMGETADELARAVTRATPEDQAEAVAFLKWLEDGHFILLGRRAYDYPRHPDGSFVRDEPTILEDSQLGVLRNPDVYVLRRGSEPIMLADTIRVYEDDPNPVTVGKSNLRSRVHRRAVCDYVSVRRYSREGDLIGEVRFVGLFTADAYNETTRDIPLIRRKVARVIERAGRLPGSHNEKSLRNIVENYPRDELFQIPESELLETSLAVAHLFDRPRPKLFLRRDRYDRFVSALVFFPRDRYSTDVRQEVGEILRRGFDGRLSAFYPYFGEGPLARVHYIIGLDRGHPEPDLTALEARIAAAMRSWDEDFQSQLLTNLAAPDGQREELSRRYAGAFSAAYRERFDAEEALRDVVEIARFEEGQSVRVRAWRREGDAPDILRCKIYQRGEPLELSSAVPILERMGLFVRSETGLRVAPARFEGEPHAPVPVYVHDVDMRSAEGERIDFARVEHSFEEAFAATWEGRAEVDGFNRLILRLGIGWREAALVRALARYRQQSGLDPSQDSQIEALVDNREITSAILELFRTRFDPASDRDMAARARRAQEITAYLQEALEKVSSLDADRVLRRMALLVNAIQRTNFYQTGADGRPKSWISFKVASRELADLPAPRPYREIFVWSPTVEGVHFRFGPVARGGLRWSDRRDDFRTEVLWLVATQQVKNAIIVPVGAKGGFFPKRLPRGGAPEAVRAEAVAAYRMFLWGLLDLTDNVGPDGGIIAPASVVRWDGDDPYLVVAADKGTATFSDIANAVAADYGHWLGDAFASGGSAGYDHKGMGITARGGWEAVKRHFRELGHDCQSQPFSVIGVGDMSGDVFGNAMLLSRAIRLVAAFDHRHIFLDPDPADLEAALAERQRLFDLPRSSWADYDRRLISEGGGVYARTEKSIPLSPAVRALTGLTADSVTPVELMHALLGAPCDLMWFGGIGTYVKAAAETHAEVGDRANDAIRVDAERLRARVVGEGANLGMTQRARIAAARTGVRLNTDAVDNSAGVDTSDHEVNLKILLADALRAGALAPVERDPLLRAMTDEVAAHVLAHNYAQTRALTLASATAVEDLDAHGRMIARLEAAGKLDRGVETLPSNDALRAMRDAGQGLTRPELSRLVAYAKLDLKDELVSGDAIDDPHFITHLETYFPHQVAVFAAHMRQHRLRREIVATVVANDVVDLGGPTFVYRAQESADVDAQAIVRAFEAARHIFRFPELIGQIDALDLVAPASVQTELMLEVIALLRRQTYWLARRARTAGPRPIGDVIAGYRGGVDILRAQVVDLISPFERARGTERMRRFTEAGAPRELARDAASLRALVSATDIVDLASEAGWPLEPAARVYFAVGDRLGIERLRAASGSVSSDQHYDRLAVRRIVEDLYQVQADATASVIAGLARPADRDGAPDAAQARTVVDVWLEEKGSDAARIDTLLGELEGAGPWTFAKLTIAAAFIRENARLAC